AKLCHTAGIFLAQCPEKADYSCRFDVAIVFCQPLSQNLQMARFTPETLAHLSIPGYNFKLLEYIPAAFDPSTIN
ncbi:MAG: YraN family protein, partial [Sphaerospermopsis kisseleviana]